MQDCLEGWVMDWLFALWGLGPKSVPFPYWVQIWVALLGKYFSRRMRFGHPKHTKWYACRRGWLLSDVEEAQPVTSMVSSLQPAWTWLTSPEEEVTEWLICRPYCMLWPAFRKNKQKSITLYLEDLVETNVLHPSASFCPPLDTSYGFLVARVGWTNKIAARFGNLHPAFSHVGLWKSSRDCNSSPARKNPVDICSILWSYIKTDKASLKENQRGTCCCACWSTSSVNVTSKPYILIYSRNKGGEGSVCTKNTRKSTA